MTDREEAREGVEEVEESVKPAEGGEEGMREAGFRAWSWSEGVTRSEKAVGADTGSQKASRSGLMSKGTGITMGSRPTKLHLSKQDGTGGG